jgi:putative hydrolase of the HAD superfamily
MLPKAILFDLDDTILSYDNAGDLAWAECCRHFIRENTPEFTESALMDQLNKTRRWYWSDPERHRLGRLDLWKARREIVRLVLKELNHPREEHAVRMADQYNRRQEELLCLFPDSLATLEKLKASGIRMALLTNGSSETQRGKLNRFCLNDFFEFCLVEGELGYGKPDIRVYAMALEKLGLAPEEVWMVGDNLVWDVEAAQKAGIFAIWNDFRGKGLPEASSIRPDRIVRSIAELVPAG